MNFDYVVFVQIKEKFGGLRIYVNSSDLMEEDYKKVMKIIRNAEDKSYKTCETCGKEGRLRRKGWMTVECDECNKKG